MDAHGWREGASHQGSAREGDKGIPKITAGPGVSGCTIHRSRAEMARPGVPGGADFFCLVSRPIAVARPRTGHDGISQIADGSHCYPLAA
jgi:hypothetical protein